MPWSRSNHQLSLQGKRLALCGETKVSREKLMMNKPHTFSANIGRGRSDMHHSGWTLEGVEKDKSGYSIT